MPDLTTPTLLYDGPCHLCQRSVRFIIRRQKTDKLRFLPLQSEEGRELLSALRQAQDSALRQALHMTHPAQDSALRQALHMTHPAQDNALRQRFDKLSVAAQDSALRQAQDSALRLALHMTHPAQDSALRQIKEIDKLLSQPQAPAKSLILIENGNCYLRSDAALHIAKYLRRPWSLLRIFILIPRPLRDAAYDFIARNRYRWFGKDEGGGQCDAA